MSIETKITQLLEQAAKLGEEFDSRSSSTRTELEELKAIATLSLGLSLAIIDSLKNATSLVELKSQWQNADELEGLSAESVNQKIPLSEAVKRTKQFLNG